MDTDTDKDTGMSTDIGMAGILATSMNIGNTRKYVSKITLFDTLNSTVLEY
jgi:hypothetical protein